MEQLTAYPVRRTHLTIALGLIAAFCTPLAAEDEGQPAKFGVIVAELATQVPTFRIQAFDLIFGLVAGLGQALLLSGD